VAASAAVMLAAADTYVVVLALTDMMAGVGLGIESLQQATPIISGFLLGYIAVLPLIGRLADLLEHSRVLMGCLVIFVAGSVVTALAVELSVLVAGRFIQGVGGGGLVPATLAMVAARWPAERRGAPLGVVGAVQELGAVLGPLLGAAILAVSGWRTIFWVNAVVGTGLYAVVRALVRRAPARGAWAARGRGALTARAARAGRASRAALGLLVAGLGVLTLWAPDRLVTDVTLGVPFVPFSGGSRVATPIGLATLVGLLALAAVTAHRWLPVLLRVDLLGAVLVAVSLGSLVLSFSSSDPEKEVVGPLGHAFLPVGAVALLLYAWRHRTAAAPLIPRGVLRGRGVFAVTVSLLVGAALVAILVDVPILARLTLTDSQTTAALVLVRFLVAVPVGALLGGWSLRALGNGVVAALGLSVAGAGLLVMAGWGKGSLASGSATLVLVGVGLGLGLSLAPVNAAALADSPEDAHGVASALVVVARMVGMVAGLAVLTAVGLHRYYETVARLPDQGDPQALLDAALVQVQTVFLGGGVAALLGVAAALAMGLRRDDSAAGQSAGSRDADGVTRSGPPSGTGRRQPSCWPSWAGVDHPPPSGPASPTLSR